MKSFQDIFLSLWKQHTEINFKDFSQTEQKAMLDYSDELLYFLDFLCTDEAREKSSFDKLALDLVIDIQAIFLSELQKQDENAINVTYEKKRIKKAVSKIRALLANDTEIGKKWKIYQALDKKMQQQGNNDFKKMLDDFSTAYKVLSFLELQVTDIDPKNPTKQELELELIADDNFTDYLQFLGQFTDEITLKQPSKERLRKKIMGFNRFFELKATSKINLFIQNLQNPLKKH